MHRINFLQDSRSVSPTFRSTQLDLGPLGFSTLATLEQLVDSRVAVANAHCVISLCDEKESALLSPSATLSVLWLQSTPSAKPSAPAAR